MNPRTILVMDDEPGFRAGIRDFLQDSGYHVLEAGDGATGLALLHEKRPDAVLLDLFMPGMDGFQALAQLREAFPQTPVVVLSGVGLLEKAVAAIRQGAWDFLSKPLADLEVLLLTLERVLERAHLLVENNRYREHLERMVRTQVHELVAMNRRMDETQREIIYRIGDVIETRSGETGSHVVRVALSAAHLARLALLPETMVHDLEVASPMHDVGKVGIPDAVLMKIDPLSPEELSLIRTHTAIGHRIFSASELPILKMAAEIALHHHERWDGGGYPTGLSGEAIPIGARITSVVDVFDALTHHRCYKQAWPVAEALKYLADNAGTQFDPALVALFLDDQRSFLEIRERRAAAG